MQYRPIDSAAATWQVYVVCVHGKLLSWQRYRHSFGSVNTANAVLCCQLLQLLQLCTASVMYSDRKLHVDVVLE